MNPFTVVPYVPPILLFVLYIWALVWKGIALWRATRNKQINWFIALLILNTVGILEIIYLFFFCKDKLTLKDLQKISLAKFLKR